MGVGEAFEQMAGDLLGFVEPALVDEIDGGIGIGGEFVLGIVGIDVNVAVEFVEAVDDIDVDGGTPCGGGQALVFALGYFWFIFRNYSGKVKPIETTRTPY